MQEQVPVATVSHQITSGSVEPEKWLGAIISGDGIGASRDICFLEVSGTGEDRQAKYLGACSVRERRKLLGSAPKSRGTCKMNSEGEHCQLYKRITEQEGK